MRLQKIAYRYVTTWFIPDPLLILADSSRYQLQNLVLGASVMSYQPLSQQHSRGFRLVTQDAAMVFLDGLSLFMVELRQMEALTLLRLFRNLRLVRLLKMTNRFRLLKDVITSMGYGSEGTSVFVETVVPGPEEYKEGCGVQGFLGVSTTQLGTA